MRWFSRKPPTPEWTRYCEHFGTREGHVLADCDLEQGYQFCTCACPLCPPRPIAIP